MNTSAAIVIIPIVAASIATAFASDEPSLKAPVSIPSEIRSVDALIFDKDSKNLLYKFKLSGLSDGSPVPVSFTQTHQYPKEYSLALDASESSTITGSYETGLTLVAAFNDRNAVDFTFQYCRLKDLIKSRSGDRVIMSPIVECDKSEGTTRLDQRQETSSTFIVFSKPGA